MKPTYPDFKFTAPEIKKYIESAGIFSILLTNGKTVTFEPTENEIKTFHQWLKQHQIENIKDD
ncbi:hypothetical protein D3C86_1753400 [compost metagenome]